MMMIVSREWFLTMFILDIIKKLICLINGLEKGSIGTIIIPTTEELEIYNDDIVIEGTPKLRVRDVNTKTVKSLHNILVEKLIIDSEDVLKEYTNTFRDSKIQKFRVISIDDNRKGNLQHYKLGVAE